MEASGQTLGDLPLECRTHVLCFLSLVDLAASAATCTALREAAADPALWAALLREVWHSQAAPSANARTEFMARLASYRAIAELEMDSSDALYLDQPQVNELKYNGLNPTAWSHNETVGVACACAAPAWPVGDGADICYFEMVVINSGTNGYTTIGWCRDGYPRRRLQLGWVRHSYAYHGDDGRAYAASGYGRRFGTPYRKGMVVGTGLLRPHDGSPASIFFTLDGILVGVPFRGVVRPELLRPAVGMHSEGEAVSIHFGANDRFSDPCTVARLLSVTPPRAPCPFLFDVGRFAESDVAAELSGRVSAADHVELVRMAAAGAVVDAPPGERKAAVGSGSGASASGASAPEDDEDDTEEELGEDPEGLDVWIQELASIIVTDDDAALSEASLEELRHYARYRMGHQADNLHPSWGAPTAAELPPTVLRHLVIMLMSNP